MNSKDESKRMAQAIVHYISERRYKKKLALLKEKPKKDKGGINTRLVKIADRFLGKSHEPLTMLVNQKKDKAQSLLDFQQSKYQDLLSLLGEFQMNNQVIDITQEYRETLQFIDQEHEPATWLNQWVEKARDISFATHVAKLTHSSSKSSSIYDKTTSKNPCYLTTNTLSTLHVDTATANAASAPAGEILTVEINGKSLLDYVKENDQSAFEYLTGNQENIDRWILYFKQAYDSDKKTSHFLSKQVYYPIDNESYHLLFPLVSSSMAHDLFLKFKAFSDDESALIRDQKNKKKYHDKPAVSYPNKASLNITGSNHSNASSLNGKRGGRITLLSCAPPKWRSVQFSMKQESLFNRQLSFQLQEEIRNLQRLLLLIKSKGIGNRKPEMYQATVNNVNEISQGFFYEVTKIVLSDNEEGWTQSCSLTLPQQLLLEPCRSDKTAMQEKSKRRWQAEVADNFASWLNQQLQHKKLNLTPIQKHLWKDIFTPSLREFIAVQEVVL